MLNATLSRMIKITTIKKRLNKIKQNIKRKGNKIFSANLSPFTIMKIRLLQFFATKNIFESLCPSNLF